MFTLIGVHHTQFMIAHHTVLVLPVGYLSLIVDWMQRKYQQHI